jgi:hypothetical protein
MGKKEKHHNYQEEDFPSGGAAEACSKARFRTKLYDTI